MRTKVTKKEVIKILEETTKHKTQERGFAGDTITGIDSYVRSRINGILFDLIKRIKKL